MNLSKEDKLAHELANALNDLEALPFYRSCVLKYSEEHLRKLLQRVLSVPEQQIRKTRGALFTFLLLQHGQHKYDPRY